MSNVNKFENIFNRGLRSQMNIYEDYMGNKSKNDFDEVFNNLVFEECECPTCGRKSLRIKKTSNLLFARHNTKEFTTICQLYGFCSFNCLENFGKARNVLNKTDDKKG